jgi:hypothetical protein
MGDHLEQAADRAEKLARAVTDDGYEPNSDLIGRIAQHLMYLAGLIRGGAAHAEEDQDEIDSLRYRLEAAEREYAELRTAAIKACGRLPTPGHEPLVAAVNALRGDLRRELWAVLDRMPASDDDLIATVRKLKERQ